MRFIIRLAVMFLGGLIIGSPVFGQVSSSMSADTSTGLTMTTEWVQIQYPAGGYAPITVEIASTGGPRELRIVLQNRAHPTGNEVSQYVAVDGPNPVRVPLALPLTTRNYFGTLRVYDGNTEIDKLRQTGIGPSGGWWGGNHPMAVLLIGQGSPDWRIVDQVSSSLTGGSSSQHPVIVPASAPTRWIEYSAFDLVLVSLHDLNDMSEASRDALLAWTFGGGNLVVFGVQSADDLASFDRLLGSANRASARTAWRAPDPEDRRFVPVSSGDSRWHETALSRLESKGIEAYREYCADSVERFESRPFAPHEMNNLAWACVLAPDAVPNPNTVVQIAQRAVQRQPRNHAFVNTLGAALYRAGRYQEAVSQLERSIELQGHDGGAADWIFLAMAHHELKNQDTAKKYMAMVKTSSSNSNEITILRKEAEALLQGETKQTDESKDKPKPAKPSEATPEADFAVRPFGFGQLVRMQNPDPFPGTDMDWSWVMRTVGVERLRWTGRHGMTPRDGTADFWNFLIPEVGRAPVGTFQLLITLFAITIGPVNYFFFRKRRQLYLLLITVPLLALITSGAMFGYALASDGFAIRTRVRSVTVLDQARGEASSWSRISYYAGLAPTSGLRFSTDTAVYPIEPEGRQTAYREVEWTEHQHLSSGWLRSRTPTQLLTVSHRETGEQLAVVSDTPGVVRVTNNLGTPIKYVVLADNNGKLYVGENIAQGARALLSPSEDDAASLKTACDLIAAQELRTPEALQESGAFEFLSLGALGRWGPQAWADWNESRLETSLDQASDPNKLRTALEPRTYLAITDRPTLVELGISDVDDTGSLYVIWGLY